MERTAYPKDSLQERESHLSVEVARQVFVASFFFSQGAPSLQHPLFHYLHAIRPAWRVSDTLKTDLNEQVKPVQTLLKHGAHSEASGTRHITDILHNLTEETQEMQAIFNGHKPYVGGNLPLIGEIIARMIDRDYRNLVQLGMRPKAERHAFHHLLQYTPLYHPLKDAYLSHFLYFGVADYDTGIPEFNALFDEIGTHARSGSSVFQSVLQRRSLRVFRGKDGDYQTMLPKVIDTYNRHHYDYVFFTGTRARLSTGKTGSP